MAILRFSYYNAECVCFFENRTKFELNISQFKFSNCNVAKWATILVIEFDTKIATFVGIGKKGLLKTV